jgi:hypothetical protein
MKELEMRHTQKANGSFVVVAWDGGGNVPPALALSRRLRDAGHQVRVLAPRSMQARVEDSRLAFRAFRYGPDWGSHFMRGFEAEYLLELQCGAGVGQDLDMELAREPADAAVIDFMLWGALANAERVGIRTAAFVHTLYQVNREGGPGAIWDARDLAALNQTRTALGLRPIVAGGQLWDAVDLLLVLLPKAFDRPGKHLRSNVHYVGPIVDQVPARGSWDLPWSPDHPDPLVLVSFSTTYMAQEAVLQRTIDALAGLPVRGLVTTGPSVGASSLIPSANTVIRSQIDHQMVLPHADAVVTHAGLGTVLAALTNGVPLLCLPMGRDQGANSEHVEAWGAGRAISPDATVEEIRVALAELLDSPKYRYRARRMADIIKRRANGSLAVPLLVGLLSPSP